MQPLRSKAKEARAPVSSPQFIKAPTSGWYVGINIADAPEGTALTLNNAFPQTDFVRIRRGTAEHSLLGFPARILTLMTWVDGVTNQMFAAARGAIYATTNAGAAVATPIAGQASDYWEAIQFSPTGSVTTLLACNGLNPIIRYDGATWTQGTPAITGIANPITHLWSFKDRVYFAEAGTLNAYYLGIAAIGGAATQFALGGIFKLGGSLLVGATWSIDSTAGVFESCVFVTTEGEVAMYDGPYPGDPSWTLKGLYKVSRPLGRRCLMRAGGDLAIMTEDGIVPMSKVMTLDQAALQNEAVTKAIAPAWRSAVLARQRLEGWQITIWPTESLGIINLPKLADDDRAQFVANVRSGAWSQYLGWDANCFVVFNDSLYYGSSDGRVMQAEVGGTDDGRPYTVDLFPSFSPLGSPASQKVMKMVRYFFRTNLPLSPQITIKVDFDALLPPAPAPNTSPPIGALWGVAVWGVDTFPQLPSPVQNWIHAPGFGTAISPLMQLTLNTVETPDIRVTGIEVLSETGNPLG